MSMYFDTSLKTSRVDWSRRAIRTPPFVTKLSPVRGRNSHGDGYQVSLRCPSCGKKQKPPVQVSRVDPTELVCLQNLLKRLQDRHVDCGETVAKKDAADAVSAATVSPDTPNVLPVMIQIEKAKSHTETANKLVLETEKEGDAAEKVIRPRAACSRVRGRGAHEGEDLDPSRVV
jgi:hypothetical protein